MGLSLKSFDPIRIAKKGFKEVRRTVNRTQKEFDRFLDRRIGIDDSGIRNLQTFAIGGLIFPRERSNDKGSDFIGGGVSPFPDTLDIGQTRLFKSLSQKRNRGRTNFTGGLSSAAPSIKPTLFTI